MLQTKLRPQKSLHSLPKLLPSLTILSLRHDQLQPHFIKLIFTTGIQQLHHKLLWNIQIFLPTIDQCILNSSGVKYGYHISVGIWFFYEVFCTWVDHVIEFYIVHVWLVHELLLEDI